MCSIPPAPSKRLRQSLLSFSASSRHDSPFPNFSVRLNPTGNGQCQFASVCDQLSTINIMVSPEELRSNVVSFLATKPFAADGDHKENYVPVDWDVYLAGMADSTDEPA